MKKTALIFPIVIFIANFYIGCKNKSIETTLTSQNDTWENVAIISPVETPRNETDTNSPVGNAENEVNITSQANNLWEEEYENPMIKYVGGKENFPQPSFSVDIDFTTFSGTEFDEHFANVMFLYPDDYLGKTVRFVGQYSGVFDEFDNRYKHYVVFDDPKGCCVRFIEFDWNDGHTPNNYPEKFAIVDVAGVFSSYFVESIEWYFNYLKVNGISILRGAES